MRVLPSRGDYMKKRILSIILAVFTISLLSGIVSCRAFPYAEAHTEADSSGSGKEKSVTSLKAKGNWRMSFSNPKGTVTFTHTSSGLMVQGPFSIAGSVEIVDDTRAYYAGTLLDGINVISNGCYIICDFKNESCQIQTL